MAFKSTYHSMCDDCDQFCKLCDGRHLLASLRDGIWHDGVWHDSMCLPCASWHMLARNYLSNSIVSSQLLQKVWLWDRHSGRRKGTLQVPGDPSAIHLLSNNLVMVVSGNTCSIWKDMKCLRQFVSHDKKGFKASATSDNLAFLVSECRSPLSAASASMLAFGRKLLTLHAWQLCLLSMTAHEAFSKPTVNSW